MKSRNDFKTAEEYMDYLQDYYAIQIFCKLLDYGDKWQHDGDTPESAAARAKQLARTLINAQ